VEGDPDGWAPLSVRERGREWRWAGAAELGQKRELGRGRKEVGWACCFFLFFFKSFSNLFQTLFKFKSFTQIFTIIFKNFHKYFKTFKTTPQPKLMHFNMMHKHLIDSNFIQK
jgi:hypothetical protein